MADLLGELCFSTFNTLADLIRTKPEQIRSLDWVFKMHCHVTFAILLLASGLLQVVKFSGSPIDCYAGRSAEDALTSLASIYCWTSSTFVLTNAEAWGNKTVIAGLGSDRCTHSDQSSCQFPLKYYQWTAWVLMLQAFVYYFPRMIWWNVEIGQVGSMVKSFRIIDDPKATGNRKKIRSLIEAMVGQKTFLTSIGSIYLLCELLHLLISLGQLFFLDYYLGTFHLWEEAPVSNTVGQQNSNILLDSLSFRNFGPAMKEYLQDGVWGQGGMENSPGHILFPRISKCNLTLYGSGGDPKITQFLCFLFLNNINEKVFLFLWVWLRIMAFIAGLKFLSSLLFATLLSRVEIRHLRNNCRRTSSDVADMDEPRDIRNLLKQDNIPFGLVFGLNLVKKNCSPPVFKESMLQLLSSIKEKAL